MEDNSHYRADFMFITTGHGKNIFSLSDWWLQQFVSDCKIKNHRTGYYSTPYPLDQLDDITPDSRVLVQGLGLAAYDVLSQLTYGRGGKFTENDGQLRYNSSGLEPNIAFFSRQSLPFGGRGINQKGASGQYKPHFLTKQAIEELRFQTHKIKGIAKLDFKTQILPLLIKEMCYVYRSTRIGQWLNPITYGVTSEDEQYIQLVLYPHKNISFSSIDDYPEFFIRHLDGDILASLEGNVNSPVKAATDVLRDLRDILRDAVDFGGLTGTSHKEFVEHYNPIFNRIFVGPPARRNQELKALIDAGIVTLAGGPLSKLLPDGAGAQFKVQSTFANTNSSIYGGVLIKAKVDSFSLLLDQSVFMRNLLSKGILRPFINQGYHPGGIDRDVHQHPLYINGQIQNKLWVLGNPVEGPNFYTYVLPRPQVNSRAIRDAGACVIDMYQQLQKSRSVNVHSL